MRALRFDGTLRLRDDVPVPIPQQDEALVRVLLAGICNTDVEIVAGYKAFSGTLGHEFVGEVVQGPADLMGRRVCGEINIWCGRCPECKADRATHCRNRRVLGIQGKDGAFAQYLTLPVRNLHPVPMGIPEEDAVFVEPLAAAFEILEQVPVNGQYAVVLGDGKLGILCAQVLARAGAHVLVAGHHPERVRDFAGVRLSGMLVDELPAEPADVVVEATGSAVGLESALTLVRPRGTVVLKSTVASTHSLDMAPVVVKEINIVGSRCGPFAPAIAALERGTVITRPLIEATYFLSEAIEALQRADRRGAGKILLRVEEEREDTRCCS